MISKGTDGIQIDLDSEVAKAYGDQIKKVITDTLKKYGLDNVFRTQTNDDCSKVGVNKTGEYSKLTLSIMIYKMENLLGHVYSIPHSGGSAN